MCPACLATAAWAAAGAAAAGSLSVLVAQALRRTEPVTSKQPEE